MKKKKRDDVYKPKAPFTNTSRNIKPEETIRLERDEQYRTILESIEDSYYEVDLTGNFTFFNNALCKLSGCSREELIGMNNRQFIDKETAIEVFAMFNKVYRTGESSKGFDWQMTRKDGSKRYVEASASLIKDPSGKAAGFRGIIRDVTERKQAEESALREYNFSKSVLDRLTIPFFMLDYINKRFFRWNQTFAMVSGYSDEEIASLRPMDLVPESEQGLLLSMREEFINKGQVSFEMSVLAKNGTITPYLLSGNLLLFEGKSYAVGMGIDITNRKKAEELLRKSETQYRLLADHMKDQVWVMNLDLKVVYISPSVEKLLGYTFKELTNLPLKELLTADSFQRAMKFFSSQMPSALISTDYVFDNAVELELCCKDGRIVWGELKFSLVRDDNGNPISILGEGRDITERRQMEISLKKSEERYRSVFENAGLPLVIMEESLLIFMVNGRFVEMSGYEKHEIEGLMKFTDFISSADRNALMECFSRSEWENPVEYECRIAHRNGEQCDVLMRLGHIPGAGQFIASFTDITSRKQAELALIENQEHLQRENIRLRSSIKERYRFCDIIGKSPVMQEVYEFILQAAATPANVIIYGESGTGKELVAKAIHETSERSHKGFVTVHCGAIPETLMESEFFGYKKGAFTGANTDKRGYLDEADGGTLFLDEVGEIKLNMQVKLLRAIAGGGYTPVGSSTIKHADVRIIAATNRNLRDLVKQGDMREDFFYRIHILPLYLPPLRDRKDDLPLLVDHFLQLHEKDHPPLPAHIAEALLSYDWPGNIRELQNVLYRYLTLKKLDFTGISTTSPMKLKKRQQKVEETIHNSNAANVYHANLAQNVPERHMKSEENMMTLEDIEKDHILRILSECNWHRGRTAAALGINRKTLFLKMQKFGLTSH